MYATRQTLSRYDELIKWMILVLMAALVAMAFSTRAGGATTESPPALLPAALEQELTPMGEAAAKAQLRVAVEEAIRQQSARNWDAARDVWNSTMLPGRMDAWRQIALGALELEQGNLEAASDALRMAMTMDPENALAYYFAGLLRIDQAAMACDWYDAIGPITVQLASVGPADVTPNSKSHYELLAMEMLGRATELAPMVDYGTPLVADYRGRQTGPYVGDLLMAMGADQFEAQSHHMLAGLCLDHFQAARAEEHLDRAEALGAVIVYGYRDLGQLYEDEGRHLDAARAYAKSMRQGDDYAVPAMKMLQNLRQGILGGP